MFFRAADSGESWHGVRLEKDAQGQELLVSGAQRSRLHPKSRWDPHKRMADMDSLGVDVQVVSTYGGLYNYHLEAEAAIATSMESNDEVSEGEGLAPSLRRTGYAPHARRQSRHR